MEQHGLVKSQPETQGAQEVQEVQVKTDQSEEAVLEALAQTRLEQEVRVQI